MIIILQFLLQKWIQNPPFDRVRGFAPYEKSCFKVSESDLGHPEKRLVFVAPNKWEIGKQKQKANDQKYPKIVKNIHIFSPIA